MYRTLMCQCMMYMGCMYVNNDDDEIMMMMMVMMMMMMMTMVTMTMTMRMTMMVMKMMKVKIMKTVKKVMVVIVVVMVEKPVKIELPIGCHTHQLRIVFNLGVSLASLALVFCVFSSSHSYAKQTLEHPRFTYE